MTQDIFDADLHYYLEDRDNQCPECESYIPSNKTYCSEKCLNNSML